MKNMLSHRTRTQFLHFAARRVDVKRESVQLEIATSRLSFLKVLFKGLTKNNGITKEAVLLLFLIVSRCLTIAEDKIVAGIAINFGRKRRVCDVVRRFDLSTFLIKEKRGCDRSSDFLVRFPREMLLNTRKAVRNIIQ